MNRIALVGASSVGKTTVFNLLKEHLPFYEFRNESTRSVASYGFPINEEGTPETQLAIASFHLEALQTFQNTVYDRCFLDLVVYSETMTDLPERVLKFIKDTGDRVYKHYTHFVYFPIEFKSVDDGVRSLNEEWRYKIDTSFRNHLDEIHKSREKNYLTVTGSPNQRVQQILKFIKE